MFKKKPQIKNLSPLKSSERRKLADQIRKDYSIPDPPTETNVDHSDTKSPPQTLTSIRNSLLPEATSSAKFTTTHGPASTLISGNVYVGAHPGQDERILWFQIGKDERLIPTVYTLWHASNSNLVPLLHIGEMIVGKLRGGADLFAPGLIKPNQGFDERAVSNSIVAVAGHQTDTVPRWVGLGKVNIVSLGDNATGTAAEGLHWEGDELWSWSALNKGGGPAPDHLEGWPGLRYVEPAISTLRIDDDEEEDDLDDEDDVGGVTVALKEAVESKSDLPADGDNDDNDAEEEYVPSTKEVDDAFLDAFLYALYNTKKNNPVEPYGLDLPIQPSYLIANMVQPHLRHQSTHYNIKKTSWKNTKKFIKYLDKQLIVKSKDRNGGETVILDVDFNDQRVKAFQPYRLPKAKTSTNDGPQEPSLIDPLTDTSLNQTLAIQTLYRASSKLVPEILPSKTAFYTTSDVTNAIKAYVEANPELVSTTHKRYLKINPFIANTVLGSDAQDSRILASGEIDRAILARRLLENTHLLNPHHILLRNDQTLENTPSLKPKAGPAPRITLTIERRGGNKVVTAVAGLEAFYINPALIRPELQKKCAGSASVGQLMGGKPGLLEIAVQGDQRAVIEKEILGKRGVKPEWIDVIDKSKKKVKK